MCVCGGGGIIYVRYLFYSIYIILLQKAFLFYQFIQSPLLKIQNVSSVNMTPYSLLWSSWFQEYNWNKETCVPNKSHQQQCGFIAVL